MPNHSGPTRTDSSAAAHDADKHVPIAAVEGYTSTQRAVVKKSHTKKARAHDKNLSQDMTEELAVVDLAITIDALMEEDVAPVATTAVELTTEQVEAINKPFHDREKAHCGRIVDAVNTYHRSFAHDVSAEDLWKIMQDLELGFVAWHYAEKPATLIAKETDEQTVPS